MLTIGAQGHYHWLVSDDQFDLLELCPDIVLEKYVAITSIDSGELVPNEAELAAGWQSRGQIAYSPKVRAIESVPRDGWDEWYIFDSPTDLGTSHLAENIFEVPRGPGQLSVFVNYCFALHEPEDRGLAPLFWQQMEWIRPESYMADNDFLSFATVSKALFDKLYQGVKALT
jgi:hypothetical protein